MAGSTDAELPDQLALRVERSFTCTVCGYPTVHEVGPLDPKVQSTCANCAEWTVQVAHTGALIESAEEIAEVLEGELFTERQLLAYLLREVLAVSRNVAAEVMDSSESNVDNLHRRGRVKVDDANRIVNALDELM